MRETGSKITADKNKISIAFDQKIRLGPLHTLVEGYLQLTRDQQRQVDDLLETFLTQNDTQSEQISSSPVQADVVSLSEITTKKERILTIVNSKSNPNYLTAREIQELYKHYLKEDIGISTIQTNLNRLVDSGHVERQDDSNPLEYRINSKKTHQIPKILI
jgi:hypothetical protein